MNIGPFEFTECVSNPENCLNSSFCEARMIWVILSGSLMEILENYSLADLVYPERVEAIRKKYSHMALIHPDEVLAESVSVIPGCPRKAPGSEA